VKFVSVSLLKNKKALQFLSDTNPGLRDMTRQLMHERTKSHRVPAINNHTSTNTFRL
jgi:hypothetical protein